MYVVFVFELHPPHRFLLPFPTRRSSDLEADFADPDAPVRVVRAAREKLGPLDALVVNHARSGRGRDRKSTRLNFSHVESSYAVFCLQKNKNGRGTSIEVLDVIRQITCRF